MLKRKLGKSELEISPIVFGGNVFGWTADQEESFKILDALVDKDINMIDTADVYSAWAPGNVGGESETIIGKWLKQTGKRDKVLIATKVGMEMKDGSKGLSADHIIKSAENSLKRLQTDHIDLYYAHKDDESVPLDETFSAFQKLIKDGKVRYIASSNYTTDRLREALDTADKNHFDGFIAHQPEYNLFDRSGYENGLENLCVEKQLGVVTYFSLASGFLSGKYKTAADMQNSKRGMFLSKYMTDRGLAILEALRTVANDKNVTPSEIALAWIINRKSVTAPIVSATNISQLDQIAGSVDVKLSEADIKILSEASAY